MYTSWNDKTTHYVKGDGGVTVCGMRIPNNSHFYENYSGFICQRCRKNTPRGTAHWKLFYISDLIENENRLTKGKFFDERLIRLWGIGCGRTVIQDKGILDILDEVEVELDKDTAWISNPSLFRRYLIWDSLFIRGFQLRHRLSVKEVPHFLLGRRIIEPNVRNRLPTSIWRAAEQFVKSQIIVDLFRDIFFPEYNWNPAWNTSTVIDLAKTMYDSHNFDLMPILADALQDADCNNEEILSYCRSDKPHCRGNWVVDQALGKR